MARLLAAAFGEQVAIRRVERIAPWFVARVEMEPAGGGPASVVVKWRRDNPERWRTDPVQMLTERACLEFVDELGLGLAPKLLAADDESSLLVLEDLAPRSALWELLATGDPRGHAGLEAFAGAMGGLHAATVGRADSYYERRSQRGPIDPVPDRRRVFGSEWHWRVPDLDRFGVETSAKAEQDMVRAREVLTADGPFIALSNGDAGANNFFVDGRDGRIIDWEFGGYRHALIDAAFLSVPGPMWMTVSDPVAIGIEKVYRTALAAGVRVADDDDAFGLGVAAAALVVAAERLDRLPKLDDRPAGHHSRRQMIATLDAAVRTAARFRAFPHLTGWAERAAAGLRRRWPDADVEFPDAYTTRE